MIKPLALAFIVAANNQPFSLKRSSCESVTSVTVERSVMSMSFERPIHINDLVRESLERQAKPDELSPSQKMALLKLHRSPAAVKRYDEMLRAGTMHPRLADFAALVWKNLAYRPAESQWHRMTDLGRATAVVILREAYGAAIESHAGGYLVAPFVSAIEGHAFRQSHCSGARVKGECSCGWYAEALKGPYTSKNLRTRFSAHLRKVQKQEGT